MATMAPKIKAQQALEWGLINRVCNDENFDSTISEIAEYYSKAPTKSIGMIKKMLNKAQHSDLDTMLQYEAFCQEIAGKSADYKEGVAAFNEKRKPNFTGE